MTIKLISYIYLSNCVKCLEFLLLETILVKHRVMIRKRRLHCRRVAVIFHYLSCIPVFLVFVSCTELNLKISLTFNRKWGTKYRNTRFPPCCVRDTA